MNHPEKKIRFPHARRGFTLTELLVVILIIVVIAALSLVGIGRVRDMAAKAGSTSNLKQLQVANISYAADHNGKCVPVRANDENGNATRWMDDIEYLAILTGIPEEEIGTKKSKVIPLSMLDPKVVRARDYEYDRIFASYGMNDTGLKLGSDPNLNSAFNLNKVSDPARSMAFSTAIDFRVTYNSRLNWKLKGQVDNRKAPGSVGAMAYRHSNKALVVYFDGHVGELSQGDIKDIDKQGGKNNAFWNPQK